MKGERRLASFSACIGTRKAGPPTRTLALVKAGAWPQLMIPPTAPLEADQRSLDAATVGQHDSERNQGRFKRKQRGENVLAAIKNHVAGFQLNHGAEWLD